MPHNESELIAGLVRRIEALEQMGEHCSNPEDRRLDRLLRKFARSLELTAWLGGMCIKISPIVAAIWFFGDEALRWLIARVGGGE